MKKLFNEIGFSFVIGSGNWIGLSYEIEDGNYETRGWGWKSFVLVSQGKVFDKKRFMDQIGSIESEEFW